MLSQKIHKVARPAFIAIFTAIIFSSCSITYAAFGEETVYYYLHDHLGGIETVLDEEGNVICKNDYLPYGDYRMEDCAEEDEDYGFTGQEKDTETGLYYYGARYYDPVIGRFTSPDPWEGDLTDPQSLNKYSYARNNPVKYVDPDGKTFLDNYIWSLGVKYLDSKGYDIAAEFLNYSVNWNQVVPFQGESEKKGLYFNTGINDTMSKKIGDDIRSTKEYQRIINKITDSIQAGVLQKENLGGAFSNEDSSDLYLAIHGFNYAFKTEKLEDDNYNVNISITDIYDFDWVPTKNLTDVAINMAADSQLIDAIQTFQIQIDLQETIQLEKEKGKDDEDEN